MKMQDRVARRNIVDWTKESAQSAVNTKGRMMDVAVREGIREEERRAGKAREEEEEEGEAEQTMAEMRSQTMH